MNTLLALFLLRSGAASPSDLLIGESVLFRSAPPAEADVVKPTMPKALSARWNQIAIHGKFHGHGAGVFEFNNKVFNEIVANFRATGRPVPLDFEHATELATPDVFQFGAPSTGWITQVELRDDGLYGLFEFLDPGHTYVEEGRYRYFSPAIKFASRDPRSGLPIGAKITSGALTNSPFLDGMKPVMASQAGAAVPNNTTDTGDAHMEEWEKIAKEIAELHGVDLGKHKPAAIVAEVKRAIALSATAEATVVTLTAEKTALTGKVEKLSGEIAKRDLSEAQNVVGGLITRKRIPATAKEQAVKLFSTDRASFLALYPEEKATEVNANVSESDLRLLSAQVVPDAGQASTTARVLSTATDVNNALIAPRAEHLMSAARAGNKPMTYKAALLQANREYNAGELTAETIAR